MTHMYKRIFLVVLDSVGIGPARDAEEYGDAGADTVGHIAQARQGLHLPTMAQLGLGHLKAIQGTEAVDQPIGIYTKMHEASLGKDTMTGHWEIAGLHIDKPFRTFPNGFPKQLIDQLSAETGRAIIGNKPASGTAIIEELGREHVETGALIVYTSADSVLQIAAHEEVVPLEELYEICELARKLTLGDDYLVGRVIARPFIGQANGFKRTANRKDYALKPFGKTILNTMKDHHLDVISLGKIADIFDGEGITLSIRTVNNDDGMAKLKQTFEQGFTGLCFLNLVDFDADYGHRRDPEGYGRALERFDGQLKDILPLVQADDLLLLTADHGNDPTHRGTDHTREVVPLLVYNPELAYCGSIPERETFADIAATIADNFNLQMPEYGQSFLHELKRREE
ncbi:MAG TPA: phosphopentomutase [Pseudogracilibacillus sp.]|nr:phosphopentomutase [Pseudogracilibacillus sp.]